MTKTQHADACGSNLEPECICDCEVAEAEAATPEPIVWMAADEMRERYSNLEGVGE